MRDLDLVGRVEQHDVAAVRRDIGVDDLFPALEARGRHGGSFIDGADRDRNGRISVQEAFEYARVKVQQAFEREGYILSEHATLEDGGTGGAGSVYLESERARAAELANVANPALRTALEEQRQIEDQIAGLKLRKPSIPSEEYDKELEKLVTALALKSRAIQQLEGKK